MERHCESREARGNLALLWGEGVVIVREFREFREFKERQCSTVGPIPKLPKLLKLPNKKTPPNLKFGGVLNDALPL